MAGESDGIEEMGEELIRAGLLIGTRVAARRQQAQAEALTDAARQSQQAATEERGRQRAAQQEAVGSLAGVNSSQWWDYADADDIRQAWTTAREHQGQDPRADRAVYRMADELHDRYGVDVRDTDPSAFGDQPELPTETTLSSEELRDYDQRAAQRVDELHQEAQDAPAERAGEIERETRDLTEMREAIAEDLTDRQDPANAPDAIDLDAHQERRQERRELVDAELHTGTPAAAGAGAQTAYDSMERREQLRERLHNAQLPDRAVDARVLTDIGQAAPAAEAVTQRGQERPQARPAGRNPRGRAPSRQRSR